jgi:hypothetical protein
MELEPKEKISALMPESDSTPEPNMDNTKWFDFIKDLDEKGGLKGTGINSCSARDDYCKGRTAEGTIFHVWRAETFFMLDMDKKEDALVEAISKTLGRQPTRYSADPKTEHYVAEWEEE